MNMPTNQNKFIPREKLSKKKRRELDAQKRNSWSEIKPVMRLVESKKGYNRQREKVKTRDLDI